MTDFLTWVRNNNRTVSFITSDISISNLYSLCDIQSFSDSSAEPVSHSGIWPLVANAYASIDTMTKSVWDVFRWLDKHVNDWDEIFMSDITACQLNIYHNTYTEIKRYDDLNMCKNNKNDFDKSLKQLTEVSVYLGEHELKYATIQQQLRVISLSYNRDQISKIVENDIPTDETVSVSFASPEVHALNKIITRYRDWTIESTTLTGKQLVDEIMEIVKLEVHRLEQLLDDSDDIVLNKIISSYPILNFKTGYEHIHKYDRYIKEHKNADS